ncbi:MAG TPA: YfiR family protein, partial [Rubrivivax sp.]|nr:YfiR family protein [Rubrivivax sp.]
VRRINQFDALAGCNLVFVAGPAMASLSRIVAAAKGKPMLTVVEGAELRWRGAAITLMVESERIAFEVDMAAVREANLTLSSKILRLAREVRQ